MSDETAMASGRRWKTGFEDLNFLGDYAKSSGIRSVSRPEMFLRYKKPLAVAALFWLDIKPKWLP